MTIYDRALKWEQAWPGTGDVTVWVDVAKANAAWCRDDLYIPEGAPDHQWKYTRFGEWLIRAAIPIEMPHITLRYWTLHFTDGRHRFAWLRDHGVVALPVTTDADLVERTMRVIGSPLRVSTLP